MDVVWHYDLTCLFTPCVGPSLSEISNFWEKKQRTDWNSAKLRVGQGSICIENGAKTCENIWRRVRFRNFTFSPFVELLPKIINPIYVILLNCCFVTYPRFKSNEDYVYVRGRGRGKYICEECGIRCKKPSMLRKHIRTHSDVRPYHCTHCNFSFKTKGQSSAKWLLLKEVRTINALLSHSVIDMI